MSGRRAARFRGIPAGWVRGTALGLLAWLGSGCATGWVERGGRFVHEGRGLSISAPPGGPWREVSVEGATLTLQGPSGATFSWLRACEEHPPSARNAARALLRSIDGLVVDAEGPLDAGPGSAWRVEARVREGRRELAVHTVTRVVGDCTDDWVLVASRELALADAFEAWWGSVRASEVAAGAPPGAQGEAP